MSVELIYQLSATLLTLGLLFLGFNAYGRFSSYDHDNELTEADNPAVGWVTFGYMAALLIVLTKVLANEADHGGDTQVMVYDLLELFIYSVLAIVLRRWGSSTIDSFYPIVRTRRRSSTIVIRARQLQSWVRTFQVH